MSDEFQARIALLKGKTIVFDGKVSNELYYAAIKSGRSATRDLLIIEAGKVIDQFIELKFGGKNGFKNKHTKHN